MKAYFHKYRNLHIWLLADCILLLAFFSLRGQRWLMNAVAEGFTGPLRRVETSSGASLAPILAR